MTHKMDDEGFTTRRAQSRRRSRQNDAKGPKRDLPDPTAQQRRPAEAVYNELSPQDAQRVGQAVTKKDLKALTDEVNGLYKQVTDEFSGSPEQAAQALTWLNEAHMVAIARPDQFMLGKFRVLQTRLLLRQVNYSQQSAKKYQWRLTLWNLLWLIGLGALFGLDGLLTSVATTYFRPTGVEAELARSTVDSLVWFFQPWYCVLAGGIGGALTALMILGRQVSRRQFDPASNLDYLLNPLKGVVLGGVTYYILLGGFSMIAAASAPSELSQIVQIAKSPLFILIAFIAGFAQARIVEYLPRVWGQVTGGQKEEGVIAEQVARVTEASASAAFSRNRSARREPSIARREPSIARREPSIARREPSMAGPDPSMANGYAMGDPDQYVMGDPSQDPSSQMNDYPAAEFFPKDNDNYEPFDKVRRN
ncbi:MAG: hypothetical protein ACPGWR_06480 [Ardenticatenaceae bacterium]